MWDTNSRPQPVWTTHIFSKKRPKISQAIRYRQPSPKSWLQGNVMKLPHAINVVSSNSNIIGREPLLGIIRGSSDELWVHYRAHSTMQYRCNESLPYASCRNVRFHCRLCFLKSSKIPEKIRPFLEADIIFPNLQFSSSPRWTIVISNSCNLLHIFAPRVNSLRR